jgi:energy-coupling factor transporter ATP-binding protein EcfA2
MADTLKEQLTSWLEAQGKMPTPSRLKEAADIVANRASNITRNSTAPHVVRGVVGGYMLGVSRSGAQDYELSCVCPDFTLRGKSENQPCAHIWALAEENPALIDPHAVFAVEAKIIEGGDNPFQREVRQAISNAIAKLSAEVRRVIEMGETPILLGPTGTGKTSAVRHLAMALGMRYEEVAGMPTMTEADLVGLRLRTGDVKGIITRAFELARAGNKVFVMIDEFNRLNIRAQDGLMGVLLPIDADIAQGMGYDVTEPIYRIESPMWGPEIAPAQNITWVMAANPWGNELDPALVRRIYPIWADFDDAVANKFSPQLAEIIKATWSGVRDGRFGLPMEYQLLATAENRDDSRILARYHTRMRALDRTAAEAFDVIVRSQGMTIPAHGR